MADRRRCTVYENKSPGEGKLVLIPSSASLQQFIEIASKKLGINGRKLYLDNGGEIDSIDLIRDNDHVYVSCGEPFHGKSKKADASGDMYSIAVMGPGAVGKSAMTLQYVQGVFVIDYDPTIEDAYRKNVSVDGQACLLDILDTAGQEDYTALRSTWMRERDGFIMVFSLADKKSVQDLQTFYDQLAILNEEQIPPIVVAGNKADLVAERQVQYEVGKALATDEFKAEAYFETSAKTGQNVDKCYAALVRAIRKKNAQSGGKDRGRTGKKKGFCVVL